MVLGWINGKQRQVSNTVMDHIGDMHSRSLADDEELEPQTPAPTFMMRAFKQAIFGTPKPDPEADDGPPPRDRQIQPKFTKESITRRASAPIPRRKSADGARAKALQDVTNQASPAKGILMTPGAGGTRRKTVSFGDHKEHETAINDAKKKQTKKLTKFEERLLEGREKDDSPMGPNQYLTDDEEETANPQVVQPLSESEAYWKEEYDSLSARSAEEVRKLTKKEQLAKRFAKMKDSHVNDLEKKLAEERDKVAKLERQLETYVAKLARATKDASDCAGKSDSSGPAAHSPSLVEAYKKIDTLHKENEQLQSQMRQMQSDHTRAREASEDEIRRLKRAGRSWSATTPRESRELPAKSPRPPVKDTQRAEQSSDIWADVGQSSTHAASEQSSLDTRSRKSRLSDTDSRRPLGRRTIPNFEDSQRVLDALKARQEEQATQQSGQARTNGVEMTEERREAAKKRLEERKKARQTSGEGP